jgi:hypothetical protein
VRTVSVESDAVYCVRRALRTFSRVAVTLQVKQFGSSTGSAQDLDALGRLMNRTDPPMRDQAQVSVCQFYVMQCTRSIAEDHASL